MTVSLDLNSSQPRLWTNEIFSKQMLWTAVNLTPQKSKHIYCICARTASKKNKGRASRGSSHLRSRARAPYSRLRPFPVVSTASNLRLYSCSSIPGSRLYMRFLKAVWPLQNCFYVHHIQLYSTASCSILPLLVFAEWDTGSHRPFLSTAFTWEYRAVFVRFSLFKRRFFALSERLRFCRPTVRSANEGHNDKKNATIYS